MNNTVPTYSCASISKIALVVQADTITFASSSSGFMSSYSGTIFINPIIASGSNQSTFGAMNASKIAMSIKSESLRIAMDDSHGAIIDEHSLEFADKKFLKDHLIEFSTLAIKHFNLSETPSCKVKSDPETDEQYISVALYVYGSVESFLTADRKFRADMIKSIPMEKLYQIRASFNIVD